MRTLPDVLIVPRGADDFVALNPFTRTALVCDTAFVGVLGALREGAAPTGGPFRVADATVSEFGDGLLGDPTGLDRAASAREAEPLDLDAALALAQRRWIVGDPDALAAHLGPRRSVLDRGRRGTIHQRVGDHVLFGLRQRDVDAWWADQKFADGRRAPADGPYRWVQWDALEPWAAAQDLDGADVLDFGCGPGLFARLFARCGARVVAVDTNEEHLATARSLAAEDGVAIETRTLTLPAEEHVPDGPFDLIFLSDVLMFYFVPYDASAGLDPAALLTALRARLRPGGRIVVTEPNGVFWQRPWLGAPDRPFTILTEYRTHRDTVTPTLEELSRAAEAAGLAIRSVRELVPSDPGAPDDRARRYAAEFPLWWLLELVAL